MYAKLGTGVFQLALALVLGAAVGLEREVRGRAAGLRTLSLVSFGSTLVMIVASDLSYANIPSEILRLDPGRIVAGIVMGIGFLGAGVILRIGELVRGVTTAASIWVVAAIGLTVGAAQYALAIIATVMALFVLALLNLLERRIPVVSYRHLTIRTRAPASADVLERAERLVTDRGDRVIGIKLSEDRQADLSEMELWIRTRHRQQGIVILKEVAALDGVVYVRWS